MEIEDGSFPLVHGVLATDDADKAFAGCDCAVLLGTRYYFIYKRTYSCR